MSAIYNRILLPLYQRIRPKTDAKSKEKPVIQKVASKASDIIPQIGEIVEIPRKFETPEEKGIRLLTEEVEELQEKIHKIKTLISKDPALFALCQSLEKKYPTAQAYYTKTDISSCDQQTALAIQKIELSFDLNQMAAFLERNPELQEYLRSKKHEGAEKLYLTEPS